MTFLASRYLGTTQHVPQYAHQTRWKCIEAPRPHTPTTGMTNSIMHRSSNPVERPRTISLLEDDDIRRVPLPALQSRSSSSLNPRAAARKIFSMRSRCEKHQSRSSTLQSWRLRCWLAARQYAREEVFRLQLAGLAGLSDAIWGPNWSSRHHYAYDRRHVLKTFRAV